ncbi:cytochrome c [Sphingobacterium sp. ML3W]|uniref:c-type cytochrome n=1 Tax=Sphingobacterium sp. ML3W TaxID=1538644 RepID=UPI002499B36A|nr:cytochrome c [Sphingobacterium sp. ML3W]WFA82045.1 cytochrome c [Sphingobacterium sp. ML3W]
MKNRITIILSCFGFIVLLACADNRDKKKVSTDKAAVPVAPSPATEILDYKTDGTKGVGPVASFEHKPFDAQLANKGVELFVSKCAMCHGFDRTLVGPSLDGVVKRRTPEWIMNMMLDPATMLEKDPDAKSLSKEFASPMISLGLQQEDARAILEYLRERNSTTK